MGGFFISGYLDIYIKTRVMEKTLVLNSDYTPLNITTLRRAVKLIIKGKAEIINHDEYRPIVTSRKNIKRPKIIRLLRYIYLPYKKVPLSRYNVYRRDGWKCMYCGVKTNLTLDHVLPKSRGGGNTWANLTTACVNCNIKKGSRTPEEANMPLTHKPFKPTFHYFIANMDGAIDDTWKDYMFFR